MGYVWTANQIEAYESYYREVVYHFSGLSVGFTTTPVEKYEARKVLKDSPVRDLRLAGSHWRKPLRQTSGWSWIGVRSRSK